MRDRYPVNGVIMQNQYTINIEMASETVLEDSVQQMHGLGVVSMHTHAHTLHTHSSRAGYKQPGIT